MDVQDNIGARIPAYTDGLGRSVVISQRADSRLWGAFTIQPDGGSVRLLAIDFFENAACVRPSLAELAERKNWEPVG